MGFVSLGACSFTIIDFCGPRGPLKINERLALCALDGDQVSDHFGYFPPAGTGTFSKDVVRFLLQNNPAGKPSPAFALMFIIHPVKRRPGHLGQLPPIPGASALVHGALSFDRNSCNFALSIQRQNNFRPFDGFLWFLWLFDGRINGKMTELTKIAGLSYDQNDRTRLLTRTVSDNTISPMFINQEAGIFQSTL